MSHFRKEKELSTVAEWRATAKPANGRKGYVVDLKGYMVDLKGYMVDLKGCILDLKGYMVDLKGLRSSPGPATTSRWTSRWTSRARGGVPRDGRADGQPGCGPGVHFCA
eukprot:1196181-Prorocentrum_minimum.AAC.14